MGRDAETGRPEKVQEMSSQTYPYGGLAAHTCENGSAGAATEEREQRLNNQIMNTTHNRKEGDHPCVRGSLRRRAATRTSVVRRRNSVRAAGHQPLPGLWSGRFHRPCSSPSYPLMSQR
jgi:hypothetical protein